MTDVDNPADPQHRNHLIPTNGLRAEKLEEPKLPVHVEDHLLGLLEKHLNEKCGFITNTYEVVEVQNSHGYPISNFYMDDDDVRDSVDYIYNETQQQIIGIWHTHPNGYPWPSPRDIVGWPNLALGWRYFLVSKGEITEWKLVRQDGDEP